MAELLISSLSASSNDKDQAKDIRCVETFRHQVARHFALEPGKIEGILSCTPYQRDVMNNAIQAERHAVGYTVYEVPNNVDVEHLAMAWKKVVRCIPGLRSLTFTSEAGEHYLVVLSESFSWRYLNSVDVNHAIVEEGATAALTGSECNRFSILQNPVTKKNHLIWTFNYAVVDAAFQERVLQNVLTVYGGGEVQRSEGAEALATFQADEIARGAKFWHEHFDGIDATVFPTLASDLTSPHPNAQAEHRIQFPPTGQQEWKDTTVVQAALGVLLSRYTHSSEALFGIVTERPPLLAGQERPIDGATRTIVPARILCPPHQSLSDLMHTITTQDSAMREFEQIGVVDIRRTSHCEPTALDFQTVLIVSREIQDAPSSRLHQVVATGLDKFFPYHNHALLLSCHIVDNSALLHARYDSRVIEDAQMGRFLQQLGFLITQFRSRPGDLLLRELDTTTRMDRSEIESWNSKQLRMGEICIHEAVFKWTADTPGAIAVDAWDGQWTYAELDAITSSLARRIQALNLDIGQVVPLCFEKSKWTVAGMFAVLKAGLAFTLIDPAFPAARIAQICRQTSATIALTSKKHTPTMSALVSHCVVVDDMVSQWLSDTKDGFMPVVKPQDLAYILFTSGSTGDPKGSMIEHRAFASSAIEFGIALGIDRHTRALQFASYAFGACMLEIVTTLMHGGCVCIPSEHDRMSNLPGFITHSRVNWALLTPSLIRHILPESVPGLRTLVLAGEPMSTDMRDTWASRIELINGYGQSETSTICSATKVNASTAEPNSIGHAVGARFWIADPDDSDKLAPIGCIGELIIESPGVARGYVGASTGEKSPFLKTPPKWYRPRQSFDSFMFYRTGDLARYKSDGSVVYLGRKDFQVKIRGQRVEVGDVETNLRRQLPDNIIPVVEAIKAVGVSKRTILIAFLIGPFRNDEDAVKASSGVDSYILSSDEANSISTKLQQVITTYSLPSYYIRLEHLPTTPTGKTDRRRLRIIGTSLLEGKMKNIISGPPVNRGRFSESENELREIWYRCFELAPESNITRATFFELGGDSITAMRMTNMAREYGMELKVDDIVKNPTFAGLLATIERSSTPRAPIPSTAYEGPVE
ncbi:hypothetical protein J1614_010751, partial [Plenodomus biglobosus]